MEMKKVLIGTMVVAALAACSPQEPQKKEVALDSERAQLGYAMGMDVGTSLSQLGGDIDSDAFIEAFRTTLEKGNLRLKPEEAAKVKQAFTATRSKKWIGRLGRFSKP